MDLKSNEPFWLIKNGLLATYPSLHQDKTCDILIIGGGITGALIAHQCIAMGKNCVLIDKREIVNGSSAATTSMLQYEIDTPLYQLKKLIGEEGAIASYIACNKAIDYIGSIARQIKSKAGFRRKDSLYYASRKKDISWLKEEFTARQSAGFKVNWLSADDIQTGYGLADTYGGILSRHGASLDAFCFAHELLKYNTQQGLEVFDKTELISVKKNRQHSLVTVSTGATIRAKKIIYCTGYETTSVIPEKFVDLLSTFAIVSEVDSVLYQQYKDLLIWNTSDPYLYMRTTDDGRFLIGGEDEEFRDPQKRDALIAKKSVKLEKSFHKVFNKPFFQDFSWAGTSGSLKMVCRILGNIANLRTAILSVVLGVMALHFRLLQWKWWLFG